MSLRCAKLEACPQKLVKMTENQKPSQPTSGNQEIEISLDQKRRLRDDGFVILRNAIPPEVVHKAQALITDSLPKDERRLLVPPELATHPDIVGLMYNSLVAQTLEKLMGPFPPLISCQVAVTPAYDDLGGTPGTHVDGGWSGKIPSHADDIDPITHRPKDAAKYFGEHDDVRGTNDGLLWIDPDRRIACGSYTALVGVCLSDQMQPGHGQFGVLKGLHEAVEAVFCAQRDSGGVIGAEGDGWPRIRIDSRGRPYCNGLPDAIRERAKEMAVTNPKINGWPWPELTPVLMSPGDVIIALHSLPHTPTPNLGPNPRMNVYFRVRRLRENNPNEGTRRVAHGVSDHPDRGYFGQYLEYPEDYDPWQTSIDKLCDHWSEWDGMQAVLAEREG